MTRLETPTEVMNDITSGSGAAERKRSRPTYSSLDIKVPDGMKLTTTRMPRRSQPQQQQQQQQQRIISSRPTRAQRGGFPPKSYDFISDLDDLTEAQIRSAFAQDPELAAAAAVAENDKKRKRSPYYRKKDGKVGSLGEHPQHLRAMMEEGIPVKQWIILLLLLGAGLYQLRKVLVGPPVEKSGKKNVAPKKQASAQKAPKKAGKPKGKKTSAPAKNKVARSAPTGGVEQEQNPANQQMTKQESPSPDSEASSSVPKLVSDEKAAAMTAKIESVAPDVEKDKAAAAQSADSKKPKSAKKKKKAAKKTEAKVSSSVEDGKPQGVAPTNGSAGTDTGDSVHLASAGEGDGWQTVGKGSVMDKAKDTNGSEVPLATKNAENDHTAVSHGNDGGRNSGCCSGNAKGDFIDSGNTKRDFVESSCRIGAEKEWKGEE